MGKLLCATRGGRASYRTQDAAIALANNRGGKDNITAVAVEVTG